MTDRLLRVALIVVSVAGIAVAAYLTYIHYEPKALICTTGGGCETVQDSKYAVLAGIPIAIFGLAAWIVALALTLWNSELARTLTVALALAALAFAAYLVILQLFVIDAICVWCMANDVVLIPLFAVLALARLWTAESPPVTGEHASSREGSRGTVGSRLQDPRAARQQTSDVREGAIRSSIAPSLTSSAPAAGCRPGCGRGSPSGCRRWR